MKFINNFSRAPPNYGFITFEDPQSVQNCLANMVSGIYFNKHKSTILYNKAIFRNFSTCVTLLIFLIHSNFNFQPLYFPDNSPDGQKLNIEEKKTRNRGPGETGGRIGGNMMSGNNGPRPVS